MGKSINGPDWTDCIVLMRDMQQVTGGTVTLTSSPRGTGLAAHLDVLITLDVPVFVGLTETLQVNVARCWPNSDATSLESCVYGLLHELDAAYASCIEQDSLW